MTDTAPTPADDLVEVQVPAEQVREGDVLVDPDAGIVEQLLADVAPDYVYAFTPEQVPLVRDQLVTVRRRRPEPPTVTPAPVDTADLDKLRDLALALADLAVGPATIARVNAVGAAADRVRNPEAGPR